MLEYDFMQNAFAAATIVAIVSGLVGYFLVLRGQTFAGHALAHVGFTGATGAVLIGVPPLWGLVAMTMAAGLGMGFLGERLAQRETLVASGRALLRVAVYVSVHAQTKDELRTSLEAVLANAQEAGLRYERGLGRQATWLCQQLPGGPGW